MSIRTSPWPNGVPCWADVMATDVRASGAFYSAVLGWTVPEPEEQWGGYVTAEWAGRRRRHRAGAAGCARRLDAVPRHRRRRGRGRDGLAARRHGPGTGHGRRRPGPHGDPHRPGRCGVRPLAGRDHDRCRPRQRARRAWSGRTCGPPMRLRRRPSTPRCSATASTRSRWRGRTTAPSCCRTSRCRSGGMGGMMGVPEGTPSHWLVYFAVADTDAALAAAELAAAPSPPPRRTRPFGPAGWRARPVRRRLHGHPGAARASPQPDRSG
jgi:predicted enzyme related to lactoylglutathione lyase